MNVTCKRATQINNVIDGPTRRSPLNTMNFNIKKNAQPENKLFSAMISDQASQRPATDVLVAERERLDIENAPEIRGDSFEEDCVVYSTEWDSDNEDAELEVRLAKWFRCNDAKWADLMCQIQSSEPGGPSPTQSKVARKEIVEKYDDDFDVECDLHSIKLTPSGDKSVSPATPELILECVALPVFEEPDESDIEAWLAGSEVDGSAAGSNRAICDEE